MKDKGQFRVLLMCKKCDKVYNGTKMLDYSNAVKWYHNTLVRNTDTCKQEGCNEKLVPHIQDMTPKEKEDDTN